MSHFSALAMPSTSEYLGITKYNRLVELDYLTIQNMLDSQGSETWDVTSSDVQVVIKLVNLIDHLI